MVLSVTTEHTALQKKAWTDNRLGQLGPAFQVLDLENGLVAKAAGGGAPREGAGGHMAWAGVQGGTHVGNAARGGGDCPVRIESAEWEWEKAPFWGIPLRH